MGVPTKAATASERAEPTATRRGAWKPPSIANTVRPTSSIWKRFRIPRPGDDEVLVEVRAVSVNAHDWRLLRADPFMVRFLAGLIRPKQTILGCDVAGRVLAVGKAVKRLRPGDEVFGDLADTGHGSFAELARGPEHRFALELRARTRCCATARGRRRPSRRPPQRPRAIASGRCRRRAGRGAAPRVRRS